MAQRKTKTGKAANPSKNGLGEIEFVQTRHAPDGSPVPFDSDEGMTVSKEWTTSGDLPEPWKVVTAKGRRGKTEALAQAPPPGGLVLNEAIIWATQVLVQHGLLEVAESGGSMQLQDSPSHSQVVLAAHVYLACDVVRLAVETNNAIVAAHWGAYAVQQYELARFKREDEAPAISGLKSVRGAKKSKRRRSADYEPACEEAKKLWDDHPTHSANAIAKILHRTYPGVSIRTISGWIAPWNPKHVPRNS